ncbi:MAG TPA: peptidogalycan biosysnthesis protein, partial [Marinobacter sp.]|nr:peptidogalycan biosysnthesis protein [Marinobacter sp.]
MNDPDSQPSGLTFDGPAQSKIHLCRSINDIDVEDWQRLASHHNPFTRYDFFQALEHSGCTHASTGWQPSHLIIRQQGQVTGILPAFLKNNSRGEYVFDFAWAEAYQRYGQPYYPKLLMAVPFTPSQGPRLLLTPQLRET